MNETLSTVGRRPDRMWLIAALAVVFTLLAIPFGWAGANSPAAETQARSLTAAPAAPGAAEETSNETVGCGCAESCLAACFAHD
jgi:hypothetical protein